METKSSKQFEGWVTNLWHKYCTDIFFRTTCHIIGIQIVLTTVIVVGLWFVMEYLVNDISQTLIETFAQMLQGQVVTADRTTEILKEIRITQFWTVMIIATALVISFGFIMVYVSLTPTRRSLERKKRFISNISHELRTPLAIIRTNTDVALLNKEISPEVNKILKRNIVELDRVSEIMNNLLGLSNLMQGGQVRFEEVDLTVVAQRAIDTFIDTIDQKDITLSLKSHTNQTVFGNATALEQVVFNLIKNAIAHTESAGVVTVEIESTHNGRYVNLSVSDSGSGIERSDLYHIFEPFYRTRKSPKYNGQGLGLTIVSEIVQIHRGKIKVRSAVGKGTTVIVSIRSLSQEVVTKESPDSHTMEEVMVDFSHRILE